MEFAVERLHDSAVLVGPPGSGKTTLLKWIARRLITKPEGRFLLPLFIPLRSYGAWKRDHPGGNLVDYALLKAGIDDARQRELWSNALSYIAGPRGEHVLLLLDGWDEVREDDRPAIHREIEGYSRGFAVLLTSRPSGRPQDLPIHEIHEITELAPESIERLIYCWLEHAGAPELASVLRDQLTRSLDLRRLARNPFLLTLLCGLALRAEQGEHRSLPTSRTELYKAAIELIYRQDEDRHKKQEQDRLQDDRDRWRPPRRQQVEHLALWLLDEAPGAPRYMFGPEDVEASGADRHLLERYLKPSRLLAQWGLAPDAHHFLHVTFQEFLAACALSQATPGDLLGYLRRHFFSGAWHEVFHFVAGLEGQAHEVFWREMARLAREPDRFGHLFLRLARFASETGLENGGRSRLGIDLREGLWAGIVRFSHNGPFVDAYASLDPAGLALRVQQALPNTDRRTAGLLLEALGRTAAPETSSVLVERILEGDWEAEAVALNQAKLYRHLDRNDLERLRTAASSRRSSPTVRRRAIEALGSIRDHASLDRLIDALVTDPTVAEEVFFALSALGSDEVVAVVSRLLDASDDPEWGLMVTGCLKRIRSAKSRDLLLEIITLRLPEDSFVIEALHAISGMPVPPHGSEILIGLQKSGSPELRAAVAGALESAVGSGVVEALAHTAREDPDEEVRIKALFSFVERAGPSDAQWLRAASRDEARSAEERALALSALVITAERFKSAVDAVWLLPLAAGEILRALEQPQPDSLTAEAARLAFLVSDVAVPALVALCQNDSIHHDVRCRACESLGRLQASEAAGVLLALLRRASDQEETPPTPTRILAENAARALAAIDPAFLMREQGRVAANALARWAIETSSLVFEDRVVGPDGRVTAWAPPKAPEPIVPSTGLDNHLCRHPDVDLCIRMEGGEPTRLTFELAVLDPRIGPREDEFGPVTVPKSPRAFLADLLIDLDGMSCKDDESREISYERLAAKGSTLFRLLPLGLQMWLWLAKGRARTLQLVSDDPYLPWELIRLRPQTDDEVSVFLSEAFAVTRWLPDLAPQRQLSLSRIALVAPYCENLPSTAAEREDLLALHAPGIREVVEIEPRYLQVKSALRSGEFDAWHFIGHAVSRTEDPDRWNFPLEGEEPLKPEDLKDAGAFGRRHPWVFLNGCRTGGGGISLDGTSGWGKRFLEAGAGAFIGTHWSVRDRGAREFAKTLYGSFLRGLPIGEGFREVRKAFLSEDPLTALAYVVYAHPWAVCQGRD